MLGHSSTASQAVEILAAYLGSPAAAQPDATDPRARLDGVVYWRLNRSRESAQAYESFRRSPGDAGLRGAVSALLAKAMDDDSAFAGAIVEAFGAVAPVEATQMANLPDQWPPSGESPTMTAPTFRESFGFGTLAPTFSGQGQGQGGSAQGPGQGLGPRQGPGQTLGFGQQSPFGLPYSPSVPASRGFSTRTWALIAVAVVAAAGAGAVIATSGSDSTGGPGHYTFAATPTDNPDKIFELLDWNTDSEGWITGTVHFVDPSDSTNNGSDSFTGTQTGNDITVLEPGTSTTTGAISGRITGSTLTLIAPADTTNPAQPTTTLSFQKTTPAAFDQAVQQYEAFDPASVTS